MIKTVIIDDDPHIRDLLTTLLSEYFPDIKLSGTASDVKSGIMLVHQHKPDIILLDVEMPDGTGFHLLQQTKQLSFKTIFVTGHEAYALKAIKFGALNYILKPVNEFEFCAAIEDAINNISNQHSEHSGLQVETALDFLETNPQHHRLVLRTSRNIHLVEIDEVIYCQSDNSYTTFHLDSGEEIIVSKTLKEYEDLLSPYQFFRPHTSFLVNLNFIRKIDKSDGYFIIMKNEKEIPVATRRKNALLQILG